MDRSGVDWEGPPRTSGGILRDYFMGKRKVVHVTVVYSFDETDPHMRRGAKCARIFHKKTQIAYCGNPEEVDAFLKGYASKDGLILSVSVKRKADHFIP